MFRIKVKLFFFFLMFSSFSVICVLGSMWLYKKKESISSVVRSINDIYVLSLKGFKLQQDFLTHETINSEFFRTGRSRIADEHRYVAGLINQKLELLMKDPYVNEFNLAGPVNVLKLEFSRYNNLFHMMVVKVWDRGFKDYGIEGEMRSYAHQLLRLEKEVDQVKVLMLRRHEKDFIIRKEAQYVDKFNNMVDAIKAEVHSRSAISTKRRMEIILLLDNYQAIFQKLVAAERNLGIKDKAGLILQLSQQVNNIENLLNTQKRMVRQTEQRLLDELEWFALIVFALIIILTIVLSYAVAAILTNPVVRFTEYIDDYVKSNFTLLPRINRKSTHYEIRQLTRNFIRMAREINNYINHFKRKVDERTAEVERQKEEIMAQQRKMQEQRDQLAVQKEILEIQKQLLVEKNKNIIDSIRYAKRIQSAILPPKEVVKSVLEKSFIYYQPRDIVSGDFYWVGDVSSPQLLGGVTGQKWEQENTQQEMKVLKVSGKVLFAAVDCTGHGVPGALMSIIGYNSLNKIITEYRLSEPAAILDQLNREVIHALRQQKSQSGVRDGMDIALCSLDRSTNKIQFAGANNPLYIIRNNELHVIKGNRQPIGPHFDDHVPSFTNHEIQLQKGDCIYLFSDGYRDQFGGPQQKKFKQKQFKELLLSIHQKKMSEQKYILKQTLKEWRGDMQQVDDILVMGVRI